MALQTPRTQPHRENAAVVAPGTQKVVAQDVQFTLERGSGLGIIGPSGSGKSSLARMLVGVWTPVRGKVRLDGAALDQWSSEALGQHIGYLPQDVELMAGTVAQNIARFEPEPDSERGHRRRQGRRRARADHLLERRLRHADRRAGHRAVGGPGAAHRARARALPRPVPGGARRAEFQSRFRGRRGADQGGARRCARAAASSSSSRTGRARLPASTCCW